MKTDNDNRSIYIFILFMFGVILIISTINNNDINTNDANIEVRNEVELKNLKSSDYWSNFTFIHIDGNWSTAAGYDWCIRRFQR